MCWRGQPSDDISREGLLFLAALGARLQVRPTFSTALVVSVASVVFELWLVPSMSLQPGVVAVVFALLIVHPAGLPRSPMSHPQLMCVMALQRG